MLNIFSYLSHLEICRMGKRIFLEKFSLSQLKANWKNLFFFLILPYTHFTFLASVCRRWRQIAYDTKLWKNVSLRPEVSGECDSELIKVNKLTFHNFFHFHISLAPSSSSPFFFHSFSLLGLHVSSLESLLALISVRFGPSLRYIEMPIELITHNVFHELAAKCPNLTHMLLDFSTAMQLHDFSDMQTFPAKLKYLCICLSEVIFMEGEKICHVVFMTINFNREPWLS